MTSPQNEESKPKKMRSVSPTSTATIQLSRDLLPTLADGIKVSTPNYAPSQLTPGIVHLGVGNFFHSHFATYMDDLFQTSLEGNKQWGIVGAGIMPFDKKKRDILEGQKFLQTLVLKDDNSVSARVINPLVEYLPVDSTDKVHSLLREKLVSPEIKIVSLTVTEGGYYLSDGKFDVNHADMQHDIQHPEAPQTIFGMIVEALKKRRDAKIPPFTVMSCDNLPHNGELARSVVVGLATQMDKELGEWIDTHGRFPTCMVDRITPGTTDAQRDFVLQEFGYKDALPVFAEPFRQWVIQDEFVNNERPQWEQISKVDSSVTFVKDVGPFELMKLRILNGGHASLCYAAALLNVGHVHEAMEHKYIGPFLETLERQEIIPNVPPVPDTDLGGYWEIIQGRFANPTLMDTIDRNCADGADRQPKFIIPTTRDALEAESTKVDGLALVSALWCRYCQGKRENGDVIPPNDKQWNRLSDLAQKAKTDPNVWLGMNDVYGNVGENKVFQEAFAKQLNSLLDNGVEKTLAAYVESHA